MLQMRDATRDDVASIASLHADSWRSAYADIDDPAFLSGQVENERLDAWTARMREPSPSCKVIVAEEDDAIVGFVCAIGGEDERWGTLIDNVHIKSLRKGCGVGSKLMRRAAEWASKTYPQAGVHLWCFARNVTAIAFYERLGATIVENADHVSPGGSLAPCVHLYWPDPGLLLVPKREELA